MSRFFQRFTTNTQVPVSPLAQVFNTIDMHTGGEPLRVILDGYPDIAASSLLAYRRILQQQYDHLRQGLMYEPRGHADMYGAIVLPPFDDNADCSVIFIHNEGYSTMCGHAVIALMTLAMQMQWVDVVDGEASMTIEAPCGLIKAQGKVVENEIVASFECVPSFVAALEQKVFIPSLNKHINYDVAYGGAFYAYVDANALDLDLSAENHQQLINLGKEIKAQVNASSDKFVHPFEPDLSFNYGTIFVGSAKDTAHHSRNVCVFADGEVDRSPTGSGVSGRLALHYAKDEIGTGQSLVIESIIGSTFSAEVVRKVQFGGFDAIVPKVSGTAHICGVNRLIISPNDPLRQGFLMR